MVLVDQVAVQPLCLASEGTIASQALLTRGQRLTNTPHTLTPLKFCRLLQM